MERLNSSSTAFQNSTFDLSTQNSDLTGVQTNHCSNTKLQRRHHLSYAYQPYDFDHLPGILLVPRSAAKQPSSTIATVLTHYSCSI